jgi:hypothetical protein
VSGHRRNAPVHFSRITVVCGAFALHGGEKEVRWWLGHVRQRYEETRRVCESRCGRLRP